jgi:hypothetical protein
MHRTSDRERPHSDPDGGFSLEIIAQPVLDGARPVSERERDRKILPIELDLCEIVEEVGDVRRAGPFGVFHQPDRLTTGLGGLLEPGLGVQPPTPLLQVDRLLNAHGRARPLTSSTSNCTADSPTADSGHPAPFRYRKRALCRPFSGGTSRRLQSFVVPHIRDESREAANVQCRIWGKVWGPPQGQRRKLE